MKTLFVKLTVISLLFLINILNSFAQEEKQKKVDSLLTVYEKAKQDTVIIKTLIKIGLQYEFSMPDTAQKYYRRALNISKKIKSKNFSALCLHHIGMVCQNKSQYKDALEYYIKTAKLYEEAGNKRGMAFAYNDIGIINIINKNREKAKAYYLKSLAICEEIQDKSGMANSYGNIGIVYEEQGNYTEAEDYYIKGLNIYKEINDIERIGFTYNNLGVINKNLGNYTKAIKYHLESLKIVEEFSDTTGIITNYINISSLNIMVADSSDINEQEKNKHLKKAVDYANLAFEAAKKTDIGLGEHDALLLLGKSHKKSGNYKEALEYTDLYIAKKDSIFNINKTNALTEMEVKYESEKNKLQIENLEKKRINDRNKLIFLSLMLLLLLIVGAIILIQNINLKKAYTKIVEENIKSIDYKKQLEKLEKKEHKKIVPVLEDKYSKSVLSEKRKEDIYDAIINAMEIDKVFLNPNFKLKDLSDFLNINQMYISQVLNQKCNISFSNLTNKYRIEESKKLFLDNSFDNITIDGISQNAGFNSVKTFNRVFKTISGVTPSYFRASVMTLK